MYLLKRLESIKEHPELKTQRVLLCTWYTELTTANLKRLEAAAEGELLESATLLQKQQKQEAVELYQKLLETFRKFLEEYEVNLDSETIFQLLQSHGRLEDFLYFAFQKVCCEFFEM